LPRRLLKKQGVAPKRIITDRLRSYGAAEREIMSTVEHRSHKGLDNRAENSHLWLRKRERTMQGSRSDPRSSAFHLDLHGAPKSLRHPTQRTLRSRHSHSSHPRNGTLESRNRRCCLISDCCGIGQSSLDKLTNPPTQLTSAAKPSARRLAKSPVSIL
jgi:putative transposase